MQLHIDLHSLDIVKWQIAPYRGFDCLTRFSPRSSLLRISSEVECATGRNQFGRMTILCLAENRFEQCSPNRLSD